jgi:hypothetical protein
MSSLPLGCGVASKDNRGWEGPRGTLQSAALQECSKIVLHARVKRLLGLPVGIPNKWTVELELELTADP